MSDKTYLKNTKKYICVLNDKHALISRMGSDQQYGLGLGLVLAWSIWTGSNIAQNKIINWPINNNRGALFRLRRSKWSISPIFHAMQSKEKVTIAVSFRYKTIRFLFPSFFSPTKCIMKAVPSLPLANPKQQIYSKKIPIVS